MRYYWKEKGWKEKGSLPVLVQASPGLLRPGILDSRAAVLRFCGWLEVHCTVIRMVRGSSDADKVGHIVEMFVG